ncbi:carbamoyl phosphate synthase small subunit [Eubacteriales bacterium OttesenSCG-928-N14]|nr:carbamoyl phosphate synthase small subunit [Eubacteriales bacterium OttesenSCG-928-N14]
MKRAYLVLENGQVFPGYRFGGPGEITGEVVFTTAMTGYLETLTDKSYAGQIVLQTFPMIGNAGIIPADFEGETPKVAGYVVSEWCAHPSNFRSEGNLDDFLKQYHIPGIYGIDTRMLTKTIRESGAMNGRISDSPQIDMQSVSMYSMTKPVDVVTCQEVIEHRIQGAKYTVALLDLGAKQSIVRQLHAHNCDVLQFPAHTSAREILSAQPNGILLSNGPGDPVQNTEIIAQVRTMLESGLPVFGICLGHQLMALAKGAMSEKLKFGHRGANQPVRDVDTGRVYITSQNHGYAIVGTSIGRWGKLAYTNANDDTCEGILYLDCNAFGVQFHPEAAAGPLDTQFLFSRFINMMGGNAVAKK